MSRAPRQPFTKPNVGAMRMWTRSLRPIGQAVLGGDIEPLVRDVCRRIRKIHRNTCGGAYLLADARGNIYLLAEEAPTTEAVVRREVALLVGYYTLHRGEFDERAVLEALVEHLAEAGMVIALGEAA